MTNRYVPKKITPPLEGEILPGPGERSTELSRVPARLDDIGRGELFPVVKRNHQVAVMRAEVRRNEAKVLLSQSERRLNEELIERVHLEHRINNIPAEIAARSRAMAERARLAMAERDRLEEERDAGHRTKLAYQTAKQSDYRLHTAQNEAEINALMGHVPQQDQVQPATPQELSQIQQLQILLADAEREIKRLEARGDLREGEVLYINQVRDKHARLLQELQFLQRRH